MFRRGDAVLWRLVPGCLLLSDDNGTVIEITGPGADVWSLLDPSVDEKDLIAALAGRYTAPMDVVARDVHDLLDDLTRRRFVIREG